MPVRFDISRRAFLQSLSVATAGVAFRRRAIASEACPPSNALSQFDYGEVELVSELHERQLEQTCRVLMGMDEDSMLKPLRQMSGLPAPGKDLGGWYHYNPDYVWGKDRDGFAPGCTFGQWVSPLERMYAIGR